MTPLLQEIERLDLIVDELLGFSTGMAIQARPCELRELRNPCRLICQTG